MWGKPSKAGEEKYKKGKKISELFQPKKPCLDIIPVDKNHFVENSNLLSLSCPLSYNLKVETKTQVENVCEDTLQFIINNVEESINFDFYNSYLNTIIINQKLFKNNCFLKLEESYFPLDFKSSELYFNYIHVSEENIKQIFNTTLGQSGKVWLDNRKFRISASSKAHKIKTLKILTDEKQLALAKSLLNDKPLIGKAIINVTYGLQNENKAFEVYCKMVNLTVIKCGLVIHSKKPWLCGTPDGIVIVDGIPQKILEIKCPISCKDKKITDSISNVPNLSYLKTINGEISLKKSHIYYTQCQILMFTSGLDECDFFIYNNIKPLLLTIKKDEKCLSDTIAKLEHFYYSFYLPVCT